MTNVLYDISCAAPPAKEVTQLIEPAQRDGWDVCVRAPGTGSRHPDIFPWHLTLESLKTMTADSG